MTTKQFEALQWASVFLEEHDREPRVAEILLQHHLKVTRNEFFMNMRMPIPEAAYQKFTEDIRKHAETGIPVQHLTGYEKFYGRCFSVNEHVLIPRPETEELVELLIKELKSRPSENLKLVDIGTGSGIIAITLALELPGLDVYAADISPDALKTAQENAENLGASVTFLEGSFLEPLIYQQLAVDILVSNPPYIAESERNSLSDTVKNFDPHLALFAREEGLAAYKEIISKSPQIVKPDGMLAFEIGHTQGSRVKTMIETAFPQKAVDIIQDISGKDRILCAK
jgi:release factor glutamine methyltransferase